MPAIFRQNGYRFFFYSNDHLPVHVHIEKWEKFWKVNISWTEPVLISGNFSKIELKWILDIIKNNKKLIIEEWNNYFTSN